MRKKVGLAFMVGILAIVLGGCNTLTMVKLEPAPKIEYPLKPITLIVPFAPGGGTDLQARVLESASARYLGQPMVVANKTGAGGFVGLTELANSEPNGYVLGISTVELLLHSYFAPTKYHFPTALDPLVEFSHAPFVIMVNSDSPWQTIEDLIAYAKQHPGEIKAGNGGLASLSHLTFSVFAKYADIKIEHVPFKGGSETTAALLGNHIQLASANPPVFKEQIRAGKLRALATTGETRLDDPVYKDVPTLKERGIDLVFENWLGIVSPKPLPPEVKEKLQVGLKDMVQDTEVQKTIKNLGMEPAYLDNDAALDRWVLEIRKLRKMLVDTGVMDEIRREKGSLEKKQ